MLIDTQFEESYITNHHLNGQAEYRYTEVEDVQGRLVPGVVVDGHPYELIVISGWDFNPPPKWYMAEKPPDTSFRHPSRKHQHQ